MAIRIPILLVEDDTDVREPLGDVLILRGYAVLSVATARIAAVEVERTQERLIVIVDAPLPLARDTLELMRRVTDRGWLPHTVLFADSHRDAIRLRAQFRQVQVVEKPIEIEPLLDAVGEAVIQRQLRLPPS